MKPLMIAVLIALLVVPATARRAVTPDQAAASGNTALAVDLYGALGDHPGNLLFSPWSVTTALAMVREGAKGETAGQMDEALHLPRGAAATGIHVLTGALAPGEVEADHGKEPAFALQIANRVWVQDGLGLLPRYVTVLTESFGAAPGRIDFRKSKAARRAINDWVAKHTKDRIRDIVPEGLPTPDTLLAVANAIYYKAAWAEPFEVRWTKDAPFATSGGTEVTCHMMMRNGSYPYLDTGDATLVELPYRGGETSMVIVLPRAKDGLPALGKTLAAGKLEEWLSRLVERQVMVRIPRFRFTSAFDLEKALAGMGMKDAFDPDAADFTAATAEKPLVLGPVLHKAFIAVDEAGTEAAAATVALMKLGAAPARPIEFTADHPFLFLIRHRATGTILFLGRVGDPTAD